MLADKEFAQFSQVGHNFMVGSKLLHLRDIIQNDHPFCFRKLDLRLWELQKKTL